MSESVQETLEIRGHEYGQAWWVAGELIRLIFMLTPMHNLIASGYMHNWVIILSKLVRACTTPNNPDHWRDIAGYATLVMINIEKEKGITDGQVSRS